MPCLIIERIVKALKIPENSNYQYSIQDFEFYFSHLFVTETTQTNLLKIIFDIYDFDFDGKICKNDILIIFNSFLNFIDTPDVKDYYKK